MLDPQFNSLVWGSFTLAPIEGFPGTEGLIFTSKVTNSLAWPDSSFSLGLGLTTRAMKVNLLFNFEVMMSAPRKKSSLLLVHTARIWGTIGPCTV